MLNAFPEANVIFICPPSIEELEKRLVIRGKDTAEQIKIRLRNAELEISESLKLREQIRFRLVNIDKDKASSTLLNLFEALYHKELGL